MSHSLRTRLTIAVVAATAPLVAFFAVLLYQAVSDAVWEGFDRQLSDDARVMADLVELEEEGYDLEIAAIVARFGADPGAATEYQLWRPDGSPMLPSSSNRSALSMPDASAGSAASPAVWDGQFADGTPARFIGFRFMPHVDADEDVDPSRVRALGLTIGRDTRRPDTLLANLSAWFWMLGTGMVLVSSAAAGLAVRRGLRPMAKLSAQMAGIDENHLAKVLSTQGIPTELRPMVDHLNALLSRLDEAFGRERRFSSDVAHELRTPLAVLRMSTEVSLRDPSTPEATRARLGDMLETIEQTSALIDDLMELSRAEAGTLQIELDAVDVHDMVEREWAAFAPQAAERELVFRNEIPPATYVEADPNKLRRIVVNLLSNAATYTEAKGWIEAHADPEAGLIFEVRDSGPTIPADAREHLFERFWRADAARTAAGEHAGIGLSLVHTLCGVLGWRVRCLDDEAPVRFVIERD